MKIECSVDELIKLSKNVAIIDKGVEIPKKCHNCESLKQVPGVIATNAFSSEEDVEKAIEDFMKNNNKFYFSNGLKESFDQFMERFRKNCNSFSKAMDEQNNKKKRLVCKS
ncbi:MAG: hypothetical protein IJ629_06190 [Clostridia bacterium]|nr:hypothetical protein [Clostridia bacterium]